MTTDTNLLVGFTKKSLTMSQWLILLYATIVHNSPTQFAVVKNGNVENALTNLAMIIFKAMGRSHRSEQIIF